jgi:hypothetical protein
MVSVFARRCRLGTLIDPVTSLVIVWFVIREAREAWTGGGGD